MRLVNSIIYSRIAAEMIVKDMRDRSGLQNEWEQIEPFMQDEIVRVWANIINGKMQEALIEHENDLHNVQDSR